MTTIDTLIIGAGASGLFCASQLAQFGKSVLVLDHANKAGKKILMSGGGRCNFINRHIEPRHFISQNPHFVKSALANYPPENFIALVEKHGIDYLQKSHGQLFCEHSSKDILNMLLNECDAVGVEISLKTHIQQIEKIGGGFVVRAEKSGTPMQIHCTQLVVATGGLSIPTMGATGFGYQIAEQFGHRIVPTAASLVPFTFTDSIGALCKQLSGVSVEVVASLPDGSASFALPMLFTHRGLSGPAMLQLSNYWYAGEIVINLLPAIDAIDLLKTAKTRSPKQLLRTVLTPYFAKRLLVALESHLWTDCKEVQLANIKDEQLTRIGTQLNAWTVKPSGTEGYRVAEVTRGGVDTRDISGKTMQSRLVENLYFIGEVLDVTGHLGGYNFAWSWASGYACACDIGMKW